MEKLPVRGRFAPSPSGRMHLGNITAALLSWLSVRSQQGTFILRMEDLDPQRSKQVFADQILDDLQWLGLDWDEGPLIGGPRGPYVQSQRQAVYQEMLRRLEAQHRLYPCFCTRADLHSASAPHGTEGELRYSGVCRKLSPQQVQTKMKIRRPALRMKAESQAIVFTDRIQGQIVQNPALTCGDFIVQRTDGVIAYQLAVAVDDGLMEISEVVRGLDLLASTPRQLLIMQCLNLPQPSYAHIPLLVNEQGQRLSKRDRAMDLEYLRRHYTASELVGRLAWKLSLIPGPQPLTARDLLQAYQGTLSEKNRIVIHDYDF